MVLVISQETFDNAVKENIDELGMEPQEALEDAITQFKKQGVDLSNILKELKLSDENIELIEQKLNKLKDLLKSKGTDEDILQALTSIKEECDKGIANKVVTAKAGAYPILKTTLTKYKTDDNIHKAVLRVLISLMSKQPDLLDQEGMNIMFSNLTSNTSIEVKKLTLRWMKECCVMHEINRQKFFEANIVDFTRDIIREANVVILKDCLALCRVLVLDDDVRHEYGKAHDHARLLATENLCQLITLLKTFKSEETIIVDILMTVSTLLVRTEFCKKVQDAGGIETIGEIMKQYITQEKIMKHCYKLLWALAGNDECKNYIIQQKLTMTILDGIKKNETITSVVSGGLMCIAALTLRNPNNSRQLYAAGAASVIVDAMKRQSEDKNIQKFGSWAIRNMVSRNREQNEMFLELGVEEILQNNLKKFKSIEYDVKAALRDLGCNVKLKEEWTGKGGALTTGLNSMED